MPLSTSMAWILLLLLPSVVAQPPPGIGPQCFEPARQPCPAVDSPEDLLRNSSGLCPERVWPQNYWGSYWANYTQMDQSSFCRVPLEVRVGLTMSLSGSMYQPAVAAKILQMLVNMSYDRGDYCISYCVLDDQSSPRRATELYRSFAGQAGEAYEVDFLLGPATYDFRGSAAQVAEEFQKPLLLWSTTYDVGKLVLSHSRDVSTQSAMDKVLELRALRAAGGLQGDADPDPCGELCQVLQESPFSASDTCAALTAPSGRVLRPRANLLSCEGPCDAVADVDYCTRPLSPLSVVGTWEPAGALVHGAWQGGCLEGLAVAGNQTSMRLVLHFPESPSKVRISVNQTLAPTGELRLQGSSTPVAGEWVHIITDGTELVFEYAGDLDVEWTVCFVETCANFPCNSSYVPDPTAVCQGLVCDQADHAVCCIEQAPDQTTLLGKYYLPTAFDMALPPSRWLTDMLPRLLDEDAELFVCVAQNDPRGLFRDLCRAYVLEATAAGYKTVPNGMLTLNADNAVADVIARLMFLSPLPQIVLLCVDLPIFTSFINGLITTQAVFMWVISAFPFDKGLQASVPAHTLFFNTLEIGPFPRWTYVQSHKVDAPVCAGQASPWSPEQEMVLGGGSITVQEMYLGSAAQILDNIICSNYNNFSMRYMSPTIRAAVTRFPVDDGRLGFMYFLRDGSSQEGLGAGSGGFETSLGQVYFGNRGSRINLAREDFSSWRHDTILSFNQLDQLGVTLTASESWLYSMARYSTSVLREIDAPRLPPVLWPLGRKVQDSYPCPVGCRATNMFRCSACAPGYYRPWGETGCVPCTQLGTDLFQDSWAGAVCHKCPAGAYCDPSRPAQEPIALPGFYRVQNLSYMKHFGQWLDENACRFNGGLADVRANDLAGWHEAKKHHQWLFQRCIPESTCLGNNECFRNNRGVACTSCTQGFTKYETYFSYTTCHECRSTPGLLMECFIPGFVQFLIVMTLTRVGLNSAMNRLSLAAPILMALVQAAQMHGAISKVMLTTSAAREDLGHFVYLTTWTEVVSAPCLLPWMYCHLPLQTEADVHLYVFLVIVSVLLPCVCYYLLQVVYCFCGHANRHTLVRVVVASTQLALPNLLKGVMEVTRCSNDPNGQLTLEMERNIYCPADAFQGLNLDRSLMIIFCTVVWLVELGVHWNSLTDAKYLHVQERYSLLYLKLLPNMWYWRFLDEFRIVSAIYWFSEGSLSTNFACQVLAVLELIYASLLAWFAPYTRMGADTMLLLKAEISQNLGVTCLLLFLLTWVEPSTVAAAALTQQPFLVTLDEFLDRFAVGDAVVAVSSLHILLCCVLKLLDNRGALSYALKAQTGTPTRCGSVILKLLHRFPGAHSMTVHREGETVLLDTLGVPRKQRSKLLIGVASGLRYLFNKSGIFRINDVRKQVADATAMVSNARKARFMIKQGKHQAEQFRDIFRGKPVRGEVNTEAECYQKLLLAEKRVMEAELSAAVEDMCDELMIQEHHLELHKRMRRKPVVQEEEEEIQERLAEERFKAEHHNNKTMYCRPRVVEEEFEWEDLFDKLDVTEHLAKLQALERRIWTLMHEEGVNEMEVKEMPVFAQKLLNHLFQVQATQAVTTKLGEFEPVGDTDAQRRGSSMNFSQQILVDLRAIKTQAKLPLQEWQKMRSVTDEEGGTLFPQELGMERSHSLSSSSSSFFSRANSGPPEEVATGSANPQAQLALMKQERRASRASAAGSIPESSSTRGPSFLPARFRGDWSAKQEPAASLAPALDRLGPEDVEDEPEAEAT